MQKVPKTLQNCAKTLVFARSCSALSPGELKIPFSGKLLNNNADTNEVCRRCCTTNPCPNQVKHTRASGARAFLRRTIARTPKNPVFGPPMSGGAQMVQVFNGAGGELDIGTRRRARQNRQNRVSKAPNEGFGGSGGLAPQPPEGSAARAGRQSRKASPTTPRRGVVGEAWRLRRPARAARSVANIYYG